MSTWQTVALGAVAGFTIFLGLPLGRLRGGSLGLKTFLSGLSAGILVFLLFDVLAHATEPLEEAVVDGAWGELFAVGSSTSWASAPGSSASRISSASPSTERAGRASDPGPWRSPRSA